MFFTGGLIPNYILVSQPGPAEHDLGIVLPNAISVFNLLVMKAFFESLPTELEEAAADRRAEHLRHPAADRAAAVQGGHRDDDAVLRGDRSGTPGSPRSSTWTTGPVPGHRLPAQPHRRAPPAASDSGGRQRRPQLQIAANIQAVTIVLTVAADPAASTRSSSGTSSPASCSARSRDRQRQSLHEPCHRKDVPVPRDARWRAAPPPLASPACSTAAPTTPAGRPDAVHANRSAPWTTTASAPVQGHRAADVLRS